MVGFEYLSPGEIEVLSYFNEYNQFFSPEDVLRGHTLIHELKLKGLVKGQYPFLLTNKGIKYKEHYVFNHMMVDS